MPLSTTSSSLETKDEGLQTSHTDVGDIDTYPAVANDTKTPKDEEALPSQAPAHADGPSPPNGGFKAWCQVASGFCIFLNTWGLVSTFGVYQTYYLDNFLSEESSFSVSWIVSTQACLLFFGGIIAGPLYDMGYLRTLLIVGGLCTTLGIMFTSLCTTYWQVLLSQGVLVGIGSGCLFVCCMAIVGQWFSTRKSTATGIEACGNSVGGIIYPLIFLNLEPTVGFAWATRVIGFVVLLTSIPPIFLMKPLLPPAKIRTLLPTRASFDKPFVLWNVGCMFAFASLYNMSFFVPLYAVQEEHASYRMSAYLLIILNAATIPGRLFLTSLGDYIGVINAMTVLALAASLVGFCWAAVRSMAGLIVLACVYACMANTLSSLPGPAVISLSADNRNLGTRMTFALFSSGVGILIGPPIGGAVLNGSGGWLGLQCLTGAFLLLACIFFALSRYSKVGLSLRAKA